jgi:hypothetical protein
MRTFLVNADKSSKNYKKPSCNWGFLKLNTYYEGNLPKGFNLAINPTPGIIIVDVDADEKKGKNGFENIPWDIYCELLTTYFYDTKRGGKHFWFKYSGNKKLLNKASNQSIDLRVGPTLDSNDKITSNGGYAIYYPANLEDDIRNHLNEIKETSEEMNKWLEILFC